MLSSLQQVVVGRLQLSLLLADRAVLLLQDWMMMVLQLSPERRGQQQADLLQMLSRRLILCTAYRTFEIYTDTDTLQQMCVGVVTMLRHKEQLRDVDGFFVVKATYLYNLNQ